MILVTLGTQDKSFERLLKAIDLQIKNGNIKDKIIVQAGYTKYKSKNMDIRNFLSMEELEGLQRKADLIITHGGVGSIITPLKYNKKIIACPRLAKYGEHTNNHQLQIIDNFEKAGYILALYDFNKLDEILKKSKTFKPKKYISNENILRKEVKKYIENNNRKYFSLFMTILIILFIIYLTIKLF